MNKDQIEVINVVSVINHLVIDSVTPIIVDFVSEKTILPVPCVLAL